MASTTDTAEKKFYNENGDPSNIEKGDVVPRHENAQTRHEDHTIAILELVKANDTHHPMHWGALKRWSIVVIYCLLQTFVTLTSTTYVSAEFLIQEKFGGTTQVVTLGQSMFIVGTAVGPAFLGPLS
jgi:hypothetical protein